MSSRRPPMILAPGASGSGSARAPGRGESLPAVDERLATPEGHDEVVDGVRYRTMGANPPHATQHVRVAHVFEGCLAPGYVAAVDMLTRSKKETDAAPDVSVFPEGADPVTGGRRLEEIAFEVCDTEGDKHLTAKVRALAMRGVRRLFYIRVSDRAVHEWQRASGGWARLDDDAVIEDRCFRVPIPVRALVDRVLADNTVAKALIAAGNEVIVEAVREGREEGRREGREEGRLALLALLALQCSQKMGRSLTDEESVSLRAKLDALGVERVSEAVITLDRDALAAWMRAPSAR
ncbi:MAG: Uma2 family endonuclease [Polyangiales bacterium]